MLTYSERSTIIRRSLLYFALFVRLVKRTGRISRERRRLKKRLAVIETEQARRLAAKDAEIDRLEEVIEWQSRRFEIELMESRDRLLELFGTVGTRFSQTEVEDRINDLRFRPYRKPEPAPSPDRLSATERAVYDEMKENHWQMGREAGFSEAEIEQFWKKHEAEEIDFIKREIN